MKDKSRQILKLGYKLTEIGEIPKEWEVVRLGDISEVTGGGTPSTSIKEYWGGAIPFVIPTDITNLKNNFLEQTANYITELGLKNSSAKVIPEGAILLTSRATIGFCAINKVPMTTNQGFASLICKDEVHNQYFLYYLRFVRNKLESLASGSTFKEVSKTSLRKLKIPLPPLPEQQKIAEILSTVDEAIQKTNEIIQKTQELKKGLMQQLLIRGIGHTKFKQTEIGEIPEEWEIVRLREVAIKFISGGTPSMSRPEYWNGSIPWMRSASISNRFVDSGEKYITEEGLKSSSANIVPKGNVLVATRVCIGNVAINRIDIAISQDLTGVVLEGQKVLQEYVYWVLRITENRIKSLVQGSTIKGVLREDLKNIELPLPPLTEQQKIAEILLAVNEKIEVERQRKEKLEELKRGLMQVLLTGKVRVKVG